MQYARNARIAITIAVGVGLSVCLAPASRAGVGQFDGGVAVSSDYVVYGVTRSRGKPVVQAQLGWGDETGWSLGSWFSTIDYNDGPGVSRELDFYVAKRWSLSQDLALLTELTQYTFNEPRSAPSQDYGELRVALSFREMVELSASVSPDYSTYYQGTATAAAPYSHAVITDKRTVFTYAATAHFPATRHLSFNLGAGRFDLHKLFGRTYTYWSAGGELAFGRLNLAVSYIGADDVATGIFGRRRAHDRVVATLAMHLP